MLMTSPMAAARYGAKWTIMLGSLQNPDKDGCYEYDRYSAAHKSETETSQYVTPVVHCVGAHENCPRVSANPASPRYGCDVIAPVKVIIRGSSLLTIIPLTSIVSTS